MYKRQVSLSHFNTLIASHGQGYFAQAFTSGSQWAFWVCVAISVAGLVATLVFVRTDELTQTDPAASAA